MPFSQFEEEMSIVRQAQSRCQIYSASYNRHYWYPYKLRKVGKGWEALDKSCLEMMIDSNVGDKTVSNREIVEEAIECRPKYVIPKDYPGEGESTRDSLIQFEEIAEKESEFRAKVVPVIQGDHLSHIEKYAEFYDSYSHLAVGGLQDFEPVEQVKIIKDVRKHVGDTCLHGFGIGTSLHLIKAIRHNPRLLDSVDMSTAEQMPKNGKTCDWTFKQVVPDVPMPYGDDKATVNAGFSKSILIMLNYMLTDQVNEDRLEETFYEELGLGELEQVMINADVRSRHDLDFSGLEQLAADQAEKQAEKDGSRTIDSFC
jgi:hypothetical protein